MRGTASFSSSSLTLSGMPLLAAGHCNSREQSSLLQYAGHAGALFLAERRERRARRATGIAEQIEGHFHTACAKRFHNLVVHGREAFLDAAGVARVAGTKGLEQVRARA